MARPCTICTHPQRDAIDKALLGTESFRVIANRFGTSTGALNRHKADHIPALLAKAERKVTAKANRLKAEVDRRNIEEEAHAWDLRAELRHAFNRINLLFDACDRWLRDPDNPDQYDIGPRAEDVKVIYTMLVDDKTVRRKERLSALLARVEGQGRTVESSEYKHADPRELILKTSERLQHQLELVGKLIGELDERPQVNVEVEIAQASDEERAARVMALLERARARRDNQALAASPVMGALGWPSAESLPE